MIRSDFWDDGEKEAQLRQMVEAHLSSGAIAVALGCSRNAVIGKCKRLHLHLAGFVRDGQTNANIPGAELPKPRAPLRGPDLKKEGQSLRNSVRKELEWTRETVPTPFDTLSPIETIDGNGLFPENFDQVPDYAPSVAFADLNSMHCRALVGDLYCGAPIAHPKFSYCAEHAKAYLTTPARMRAAQREETDERAKLGRWV